MDLLLRPLEEFTELHGMTTRRYGAKAVDLSFPNPATRRDDRAIEILRRVVADVGLEQLHYSPFGGLRTTRRRVAAGLAARVGVDFRHDDVFLTPGATAALTTVFTALLNPGDEVLIVTPCWMDYPVYLSNLGVTWTPVPSAQGQPVDCAALNAAWSPRTKAVVISQPNCPTGAVASPGQLAELADLLHSRRTGPRPPLLISDEVHRDQTWSGEFASSARAYDDTISVYSFGKAWSMQGQRTGYLAVSPRMADRQMILLRLTRALRITGTCAPTMVMQQVAAEVAALQPRLGSLPQDQAHVRRLLKEAGVTVVDGQASVFVYAKCPRTLDDWAFVRMAAEEGVLVLPSSLFHEAGHYRLALNVSGDRLSEGVRRLIRVHEGVQCQSES